MVHWNRKKLCWIRKLLFFISDERCHESDRVDNSHVIQILLQLDYESFNFH